MPPDSRVAFATLINQARLERHLSIRSVARIAGVPAATAQGWLSGKHFPTPALRHQYLKLVAELGLSAEVPDDLWDQTTVRLPSALRGGATPYLGLRPFGVEDEARFFGRASESQRLARRIAQLAGSDGHGLVVLIGPSGSGKSSLLAAGLIARECTDGVLAGWSAELVEAAQVTEAAPLARLIVLDQLEDALRLPEPARERALEAIAGLARQTMVVAGLRSDAFTEAAQDPRLVSALGRPVLLAPMTREEVREVIVGPAHLAGIAVEDDLVRVMLAELAPGVPGGPIAPDVLPLLSNALLMTWAAGAGDRMTLADYHRGGGLSRAVEALAEEVYSALDAAQQAAAEQLFLHLVRVSSDVVTREPLPLARVDQTAREVMDAFVAARMLTVVDDAVRISHDALLQHWQRLNDWIAERRTDLDALERIRRAAGIWEDTGRDPGALIPVNRLALVGEWLDRPALRLLLNDTEREFIAASEAHFTSVLDAERTVNRRLRRQRRVALGLTAATTALAVLSGFALWRSESFREEAQGARAVADLARLDAQSRQVATMARTLRERDPNLAAQFAAVANNLAPTTEATSMLLDATALDYPVRWLGTASSVVAVSPDSGLVARGDGGGRVTVWRGDDLTRGPGASFAAGPSGQALFAVALTTTRGRDLLAVGGIGVRSVWDVTGEPRLVADLGGQDHTTYAAAFSPDGSLLALGDETGAVQLVSLSGASPEPAGSVALDAVPGESAPAVKAVALDATALYVAGAPGAVARWEVGSGAPVRLPDLAYTFREQTPVAQALALSAQGRVLAGLAGTGVVRWRISDGRATAEEPITGFESWINDVSFSADGTRFVVGSSDQSARVFDAATGVEERRLTGPAIVTGADFAGARPVTTDTEGALRVWPESGPVLRLGGEPVYNLATDATGSWLAGGTPTSGIQLWRLAGAARRMTTPSPPPLGPGDHVVGAVGVDPAGRYLVGGSAKGVVLSWPLSETGPGAGTALKVSDAYIAQTAVAPNGRLVAAPEFQGDHTFLLRAGPTGELTQTGTIETPMPQLVWFSPDSELLAVALASNRVEIWSVSDPAQPVQVASIETTAMPSTLVFAPTSRLLGVGLSSGTVQIWDLRLESQPALVREFGDPHSSMYSLAFRADEELLIGTSGDDRIWGWSIDQEAAGLLFSLDGAIGRPWDARFVEGGARFATSGSSGGVKVWHADESTATALLCSRRGDAITPEEWQRYLPGIDVHDPC